MKIKIILLSILFILIGCSEEGSVVRPIDEFSIRVSKGQLSDLKQSIEDFAKVNQFDSVWQHPNPPSVGRHQAFLIQYSRSFDDVEMIFENIVQGCVDGAIYSNKNRAQAERIFFDLKLLISENITKMRCN